MVMPVTSQLRALLPQDLDIAQLSLATREASQYILDISQLEWQCFEAYFEIRQPQESLRTLLDAIANVFYKAMRPWVITCDSIDVLREMAGCLQTDILEPNQQS